jgi:hypothetical protein
MMAQRSSTLPAASCRPHQRNNKDKQKNLLIVHNYSRQQVLCQGTPRTENNMQALLIKVNPQSKLFCHANLVIRVTEKQIEFNNVKANKT